LRQAAARCIWNAPSSRKRRALALFVGDISHKLHFVVFIANRIFSLSLLFCLVSDKGLRIHTTALGQTFWSCLGI
jgi:hypothetical protein